jgi:hypothetical protein
MNIHEQRAALSKLRRSKDSELLHVAIHEAGHAVAKLVVAGEMGLTLDKAISQIEIASEVIATPGEGACPRTQGVTYGPMFSREITEASQHVLSAVVNNATVRAQVDAARTAGADIDRWFRARVFDGVSGCMAEALSRRMSFHDVWTSDEAAGDMATTLCDADIAQISERDVERTIDRMAALSALVLGKSAVWRAVRGLAKTLQRRPVTKGTRAVAVVKSSLSEMELATLFVDATRELDRLEGDIRGAKIVSGEMPDGRYQLIKGSQSLEPGPSGKVTSYVIRHSSPTLYEVLWNAFGDGATG